MTRNPGRRPAALAMLVLALVVPTAAGQAEDPFEPPAANQPEYFDGAVGSYTVTMSADRTRLPVGDTLLLTVRITGDAPSLDHLPRRPDLRHLPRLDARSGLFKIEYLKDRDQRPALEQGLMHDPRLGGVLAAAPVWFLPALTVLAVRPTWEYTYRVQPLRPSVKEIPSWPFVFYRPGSRVPAAGSFQTVYAASIALEVTARPRVTAQDVQGVEPRRPERVYELTEGPAVLGSDEPVAWPALPTLLPVLALCLAIPPVLALLAYRAWQRANPDAARRARLRRSRAADRALKALPTAAGREPEEESEHAAGVVAQYLRDRLDLRAADPTPAEVASHLGRSAVPDAIGQRVVAFFRACEAERFAPVVAGAGGTPAVRPVEVARQLILDLEAELWLLSAS